MSSHTVSREQVSSPLDSNGTTVPITENEFAKVHNKLKELNSNSADNWYQAGLLLQQILIHRLYLQAGFRSFSDYCARGFGYSRQHVYKIIKLANFISSLKHKADTTEEQELVERLLKLGFTKLYLIHKLPSDKISILLQNEPSTDLMLTCYPQSIEEMSTSKLKQQLKQVASNNPPTFNISALQIIKNLKYEAGSLNDLIKSCNNSLEQQEILSAQLQTMHEYAESILQQLKNLT